MIELIFAIFAVFLLWFYYSRNQVNCHIHENLNNSNIHKRKKGRTFSQWLFFTTFLDAVPNRWLFWYYSSFVCFILSLVVTVILYFIEGYRSNLVLTPFRIEWCMFLIFVVEGLLDLHKIKRGKKNPKKYRKSKKRYK